MALGTAAAMARSIASPFRLESASRSLLRALVAIQMHHVVRHACVVLVLMACGRAQAQSSAELPEATTRTRIARVQAILDARAGRAQFWQYGWLGLGYAVTGGFVALAASLSDSNQRLDFAFAAGGAFIDTTVHGLGSIHVHAANRLREQPDASPEQARLKLAMAEAELAAAAEAERDRRSLFKAQILPVGFAVATGLVLGVGFGHVRGAVVNTLAAIVINELRVLTQPTSTTAMWQDYQRDPDAPLVRRRAREGWSLSWEASPFGCAFTGSF